MKRSKARNQNMSKKKRRQNKARTSMPEQETINSADSKSAASGKPEADQNGHPRDHHHENSHDRIVRLNVRFIAMLAVCVLVIGGSMHLIHTLMVGANAEHLRTRALAAEKEGDLAAAIKHLSQYLQFKPGQVEELATLGSWLEQTAVSPNQWFGVYTTYEEVLRREPNRSETRRRIVDVALKIRRYRDALDHIGILWRSSEYAQADAAQNAEFAFLAGQCHEGLGNYAVACSAYLAAVGLQPAEVEHYRYLAALVFRHALELPANDRIPELLANLQEGLEKGATGKLPVQLPEVASPELLALLPAPETTVVPKTQAERILQAMIDRAKPAYRAYLYRALFRTERGDLAAAAEDIQEALKEGGDKSDVLRAAAALELARAAEAREKGEKEQRQVHLDQARRYAQQGLEYQPPDIRFYLVLSDVEIEANDYEAAADHLRAGLKRITELQKQKRNADPNLQPGELAQFDFQFRWQLADVLISQGQSGDAPFDAKELMVDESTSLADLMKQMKTARQALGLVNFLDARKLYAEEQWYQASLKCEETRTYLDGRQQLVDRLDLMLGVCYERLGNPDARLNVFQRAIRRNPLWTAGRLQLASALVGVNKIDEALAEYQRLSGIPGVPATIARLLVLKQMRQPPEQRRWQTVEQVIQAGERLRADRGLPPSAELSILEAEVLTQRGQTEQAEAVLDEARETHPDDVSVWTALANLALRRPGVEPKVRLQSALQILDEAGQKFGDQVELRLTAATIASVQSPEQAEATLADLSGDLDKFEAEDQIRLLQGLSQVYTRLGKREQVRELWQKLAELQPDNLTLKMALAEMAAREKKQQQFQSVLEQIRAVEGPGGPNGNYIEATELIRQAAADEALRKDKQRLKQELQRPRRLLEEAARQRPYWVAVPRAQGELEMLLGNVEAAIPHYEKAIELGENHPTVVGRVAEYYYQRKQFARADQFIQQATQKDPDALSGDLARLAWRVAWQRQQYDEALGLAEELASTSQDFRDKIMNAQMLYAKYRLLPLDERTAAPADALLVEAEELFRGAIDMAPEHPSVWLSYIVHLARVGRTNDAKQAIVDASEKLPSEPPTLRPLNLGRFYEVVNEPQQAEEQYLKALELDPKNSSVRIVLADFYSRTGETAKAESQIDQILDPQSNSPQFAIDWAKRRKAMLIASSGGYDETVKALELLDQSGSSLSELSIADLQARAAVLGQRTTRRDRMQLLAVLEELNKRKTLSADGKQSLARLYESTGNWDQAELVYRALLDENPENSVILADFIFGWMNQKDLDGAAFNELERLVARLENLEPKSFRSVTTRANLLHLQGRSDEAVPLLQAYLRELKSASPEQVFRDLVDQQNAEQAIARLAESVEKQNDEAGRAVLDHVQKLLQQNEREEALAVLKRFILASDLLKNTQTDLFRVVAGLMEQIGQPKAAEETLRQYIERSEQPEAVLALAAFFARQNRLDEALDVCETAWAACPPIAVAQVAVASLRTANGTKGQIQRVRDQLNAAIEKHRDTTAIDLTFQLADLEDQSGNYQECIALYRLILKQNNRHVIALNNLAWLLAFQAGQAKEGLDLINRAIGQYGPVGGLLDTRGSVYLALGRLKDALADFKVAVVELPQPAVYFHLAQAHLFNDDLKSAREAFEEARNRGFAESSLHPLELAGYKRFLAQIGGDSRQASR